jgi:hypothetical protein
VAVTQPYRLEDFAPSPSGLGDPAALADHVTGHGGSPTRESSALARRGVASVASSVRLATPSLA